MKGITTLRFEHLKASDAFREFQQRTLTKVTSSKNTTALFKP